MKFEISTVRRWLGFETEEYLALIGYLMQLLAKYRKVSKMLGIAAVVYWNGSILLMCGEAMFVSSWPKMLPYIVGCMIYQYDCAMLLILFYLQEDFIVALEDMRRYFRPVKSTNPALAQRLSRRRTYSNIQCVTLFILLMSVHYVTVSPLSAEEDNYIFFRQYYSRMFSNYPVLIILSYTLFYFIVTIMAASCFLFSSGPIYVILLTSFQYLLLVDHLDSRLMMHHGTISLIDNAHYQRDVHKNLLKCYIYRKRIDMGVQKFFKFMSPMMLIAVVTGGMSILIIFYIVITGINPPNTDLKMDFGVAVVIYVLLTLIVVGQEYSNASLEFYNKLCECPWQYWNIQNRKMFLLILTNTDEMKLNALGLINLDFPFLVQIGKFWYSILCFMSNYRYTLTPNGVAVKS